MFSIGNTDKDERWLNNGDNACKATLEIILLCVYISFFFGEKGKKLTLAEKTRRQIHAVIRTEALT